MTLRDERLLDDEPDVRSADVPSSAVVTSPAKLPPPRSAPDEARPRWWLWVVVASVAAGVVLRFAGHGAFWLDEAQSVSIASEPLRHLPTALHHDGAPPLWYALLHFWIRVFGDSPWSVRVLSGIPAVLALPVGYAFARRLAGREVAQYTLVLLAVSPFAITYAVEARMYSLVLLLTLVGGNAFLWVHRRAGWLPIACLALVTSALLYTHYYAIWLLAGVGGVELWRAVRRRDAGSRRVVIGLAAGFLTFLPWVPVLLYQSAHTGAPWEAPPTPNAFIDTVGDWAGGSNPAARVSALAMLALVALALFGRPSGRRGVVFGGRPSRLAAELGAGILGTITLAIVTAAISGNAYAARYTSVVAGLFLVLVALGVVVLPSARVRRVVMALLALAGTYVGITKVVPMRTQAAQVASAIDTVARPGDVVAYCPDQLGPAVSRLVTAPVRQVVFPDFAGPRRIDWVDYEKRMGGTSEIDFAAGLERMAGSHTIWLVYADGYQAVRGACYKLFVHMYALRGDADIVVKRRPHVFENEGLYGFRPRR